MEQSLRRREPGLAGLRLDRQSYCVAPGEMLKLVVHAGDKLRLLNREGLQTCSISCPAPNQQLGLNSILSTTVTSSELILFADASDAGASLEFAILGDGELQIGVPQRIMHPGEHDVATDIEVQLHLAQADAQHPLPAPLSPQHLLQDLRVHTGSAAAYTVKAGEYIQIIDVEGRQCSDFLAFRSDSLPANSLQTGQERGIDVTTTRSLTARATPTPGLYSKFFDQDMRPLVEVVQDTCGRHDTFALACYAKYYEDMGYPGHANCSDNFNAALAAYAIAPRKAWPAVNFFYNTNFDAQGNLGLDEPWSRPGDYVLLRALTDLVCASSACPDDIDAANGFQPTDIHVRIYNEQANFKKGTAYRMRPDSKPAITKETAFHSRTAQLTQRFSEYRGYWLPQVFNAQGATAEYLAVRESVGIMDLSPLRKFEVTGPDAEELLQRTMTRDIRKLAVGQIVYTAICYESGCMLDDATVFKFTPTNFRVVAGIDYIGDWLREKAAAWGLRAWVRGSTDQLCNIAVQGPRSYALLQSLIWTSPCQTSLADLTWFRFSVARLEAADGIPLVISRTGYSGELGYELWCHPSHAEALWDKVWAAGAEFGLAPVGLEALDMLRIEAGLVFAGYDFDESTDPFEAGIGFTVPKQKSDDYIGKGALEKRREHPQRQLVGLEIHGQDPAAHGDRLHSPMHSGSGGYGGRAQIGVITSAMRSPVLGKNLALCRVQSEFVAMDAELEVGKLDGYQKRLPARIVSFPFYDPQKLRPRTNVRPT